LFPSLSTRLFIAVSFPGISSPLCSALIFSMIAPRSVPFACLAIPVFRFVAGHSGFFFSLFCVSEPQLFPFVGRTSLGCWGRPFSPAHPLISMCFFRGSSPPSPSYPFLLFRNYDPLVEPLQVLFLPVEVGTFLLYGKMVSHPTTSVKHSLLLSFSGHRTFCYFLGRLVTFRTL